MLELHELLGPDFDMTDFCGRSYWRWEDRATKRLEELGYKIIKPWWSGDYDSFGPLVRCVKVTKDGETHELSYG